MKFKRKVFIGVSILFILSILWLIISGILYMIDKKNGKKENDIESSIYYKLSFLAFILLTFCINMYSFYL